MTAVSRRQFLLGVSAVSITAALPIKPARGFPLFTGEIGRYESFRFVEYAFQGLVAAPAEAPSALSLAQLRRCVQILKEDAVRPAKLSDGCEWVSVDSYASNDEGDCYAFVGRHSAVRSLLDDWSTGA